MSNERSPRDVCSITIRINGLMQSPCFRSGSGAWGPQLRLGFGGFLVGSPDRVAPPGLLEGDGVAPGRDPVEGRAQAQVLAQVLLPAVLPQILDHLVGVLAGRL